MASEISWSDRAAATEYALVRNRTGQIWNSSGAGAFTNYDSAQYAVYPISATEQGTASAYYTASMPAAITPGVYAVTAKRQAGGSPAETDPTVAVGDLHWGGSAVVPLSDLATSGQIGQLAPLRIARGTMLAPFLFKMVSASDHVTPFTSGVISGQISKDGGAFGPLQSGAMSEVGKGWYKLQALTSGDTLCNMAALVFTGAGISGGGLADQRDIGVVMARSSGAA